MKEFAKVSWCAGDVRSLQPKMSVRQAEEFLQRNARHLQDRLVEVGWGVMETLLEMDEIESKTKPEAK